MSRGPDLPGHDDIVLYRGPVEVGRASFNAEDDVAGFVGVWSTRAFDRATRRSQRESRRRVLRAVLHHHAAQAVITLLAALVMAWWVWIPSTYAQPPPTATTASSNGDVLSERLPKLAHQGGPFVRHPRIVTVTFTGDDAALVSRLELFGQTITTTRWWRAVTDGFCAGEGDCIGEGRPGTAARMRETLPTEVHAVDVSAILRRAIAGGLLGTVDAESVLLVYLPEGVMLKDALAHYGGDGPRAFHRALRLDRLVIGYAVMSRCGDEASLTGTASHELLETVMSPDTSRRGFGFAGDALARGFAAAGTEAADPCGFITTERDIVESTFVLRRAWSARAAAKGHDPCAPAIADRPYVAFAPRQPMVRDLTGSQMHQQFVEATIDRQEVAPGDAGTLRVTLRKLPPNGLSVVGVVSTLDGYSHLWPVAVVTQ